MTQLLRRLAQNLADRLFRDLRDDEVLDGCNVAGLSKIKRLLHCHRNPLVRAVLEVLL